MPKCRKNHHFLMSLHIVRSIAARRLRVKGLEFMNGATYPILGAFRWMIEQDPRKRTYRWKGGFRQVMKSWEASAITLLRMTCVVNADVGRNPNAIGKSRSHWANLHARVAMRDLMS